MIFRKWLVGMLCMLLPVGSALAENVSVPVNESVYHQTAYRLTLERVSGEVVNQSMFVMTDQLPAISEIKRTETYVKAVCVTGSAQSCPEGKQVHQEGKVIVLVPGEVESGIAFHLVWKGADDLQLQMHLNNLVAMKKVASVADVDVESPEVALVSFDKTFSLGVGQSKSFSVNSDLRLSVSRLGLGQSMTLSSDGNHSGITVEVSGQAVAECSKGQTLVGGGYRVAGVAGHGPEQSFPKGNGWEVQDTLHPNDYKAFALCHQA